MKQKADIILKRDDLKKQLSPHRQTSGVFIVFSDASQEDIAWSLELPWNDNKQNISCLPSGLYRFSIVEESGTFKYPHLWIEDTPGRSGIKVHVVNYVTQLRGCIALGDEFDTDINGDGLFDTQKSKDALDHIMKSVRKVLGDRKFGYIEIIDNFTENKEEYE